MKHFNMLSIIDNRGEGYGLEIDSEGNGKFYVLNHETGVCVALKYKKQAKEVIKNAEYYGLL